MQKSLNRIETAFLSLLKVSVMGELDNSNFSSLTAEEWNGLYFLAERQGLMAVLMPEMEKIPKDKRPCLDLLMEWYGQTQFQLATYKQQYEESCEFANALAEKGVRCVVLKGLALGSYYPAAGTREFGDLDCFLVKNGKPAFELGNDVGRGLGADVEQSGCKHTHIHYKQLLIENHEYLTNFNDTQQGVIIEKILKGLILEGRYRQIDDTNLWIPQPEFNVLFLLKHSLGDFLANDMTIKSLYDWAVFLKAEQDRIDWGRMRGLLNECRLRPFFNLMTESAMLYCGLVMHELGIEVSSNGQMASCLIKDVLNIQSSPDNKTLLVMMSRFFERMKRMMKYHRITTESTRTALWSSMMFRMHIKRKLSLE